MDTTENLPTKQNGTAAVYESEILTKDWRERLDTAEAKQLLLNTVAKGATPAEFAMFRERCRSTGLDPFKNELWFIKTKDGRVQMMTGINGYYAVANSNQSYDGIEVELTQDDDGVPIKAVAKAWRKDRRLPSVGTARWSEFNKGYGNWKTMPCYMLEKCSEAIALRKAFPQQLNGTLTEEEMGRDYSIGAVGVDSKELKKLNAIADENMAYDRSLDSLFNPDNFDGTYRHLKLKFGDNAGKFLSDKSNHLVGLRRHLNKYRGKYSMPEQKAFERYIGDLEREYAEFKAKEEAEAELIAKARRDYEASQSLDNGGTQIAISAETDNADFED